MLALLAGFLNMPMVPWINHGRVTMPQVAAILECITLVPGALADREVMCHLAVR